MKLYSKTDDYAIYEGNMLDMLEEIEPNSIDSIVTDPPYGLTSITKRFGKEGSAPAKYGKDGAFFRLSKGFMGKEWDGSGIEYNVDAWKKCLEVLKPGGYLLAFGGTRTYHRIACAIEDAGFEIRDCISWIYGSGFPKSMNIGLAVDKRMGVESKVVGEQTVPDIRGDAYGTMNEKQGGSYKNITREVKEAQNEWRGWGTTLKPAYEPIIVARKPFKGSLVDNVLEYGVGGINIDECRVGDEERTQFSGRAMSKSTVYNSYKQDNAHMETVTGRFPANVILTYDETDFDEVCGGMPYTKSTKDTTGTKPRQDNGQVFNPKTSGYKNRVCNFGYEDSGSASRYFYCAKASKRDRDEGLDSFEAKRTGSMNANIGEVMQLGGASLKGEPKSIAPKKNVHPTVKPTSLMQYLIRLVTPRGGVILDPFMGSGSTGKAAMFENKDRDAGYKFVGIELTDEYLPIAKARIEFARKD